MKMIPVNDSKRKYKWAIVSDEHYESLKVHTWTVHYDDDSVYVVRNVKKRLVYLHAEVFKLKWKAVPERKRIDHKNRCSMDNRWENLRPATNRENGYNRGLNGNSTTGIIGVSRGPKKGGKPTYHATLTAEGKRELDEFFASKKAAIIARKVARDKHHGEFGCVAGALCPLGVFALCPCGERSTQEYDDLEPPHRLPNVDELLADDGLFEFLKQQRLATDEDGPNASPLADYNTATPRLRLQLSG